MAPTLTLDRESFTKEFLIPFSKFNSLGICIIDVAEGKLHGFATGDNSHGFLYASFTPQSVSGDFHSLHLKDSKRLINALSFVSDPVIALERDSKSVIYNGKHIKFVCPTLADKIAEQSRPRLNREKIEAFEYDIYAQIPIDILAKVLKGRSVAADIEKVYIKQQGETLSFHIEDAEKGSSDTIAFETDVKPVKGKIATKIAFPLDLLANICKISDTVHLQIKEDRGVAIFSLQSQYTTLKYIVSSIK